MIRIYFCWVLVYEKKPFEEFDFSAYIYDKLSNGIIKETCVVDLPNRAVAVIKGGSRPKFDDLKGKRMIEITTFMCDLLLELFNYAKFEKGDNIS